MSQAIRPSVGSLCSGTGGLELGIGQWLGDVDVRWHAEINGPLSELLKAHWPEVPNHGDFTADHWWSTVERTDILAGGIPCQPFSAAGRKEGVADKRYLWPHMLEGIRRREPQVVVFENVANLARGKMTTIFESILNDLVYAGYDVRWCMLGACAVGAPHHRHRLFVLARKVPADTFRCWRKVDVQMCGQRRGFYLPTPQARDSAHSSVAAPDMSQRRWDSGRRNLDDAIAMLPTPTAVQYGNNRGGGMGRVGPVRHSLDKLVTLLPTPTAADAVGGRVDLRERTNGKALPTAILTEQFEQYAPAVQRWAELTRQPPAPKERGARGGWRINSAFPEWMMGLPEGHLTSVLAHRDALLGAGNGVVPRQAAVALTLLDETF